MNDISIGTMMVTAWLILGTEALALLTYLAVKKLWTGDRFKRFLGVLFIALASTLFPLGPFGLFFGAPAAILASILVASFLDKEQK